MTTIQIIDIVVSFLVLAGLIASLGQAYYFCNLNKNVLTWALVESAKMQYIRSRKLMLMNVTLNAVFFAGTAYSGMWISFWISLVALIVLFGYVIINRNIELDS